MLTKEKNKSVVLEVQNVKATITINTIGGKNDGKKRT